jgi:signal transduction histidine kinase
MSALRRCDHGQMASAGAAPEATRATQGAAESAGPPAEERRGAHRPLRRYPDRGLLGGVAAGLAEYTGVNVLIVRLLWALGMTGGFGVLFYILAWALIPVAPESQGVPRPKGAWREAAAIVVVVAAALFGLRRAGLLIGDSVIWPLVLGTAGLVIVWRPVSPLDREDAGRPRVWSRWGLRRPARAELPRLVVGLVLVAFAAASLLHSLGVLHSLGKAIGAVAIVAVFLGLLVAPWAVRLVRSLAAERAARIREQERAELAAHLHDSVLQTLALIQKRAGDPREVAGLARRQERELRSWLHGREASNGADGLAAALARAAAEVEQLHHVPIEVVTVGDRPLDRSLEAMVQAAREALMNAAKFAHADRVDLYAEVQPDRVQVYVRDRGVGFDPVTVPPDRRGVRDSIIGRMERHHGHASVHSTPGEGTEVELVTEGPPS